MLQAFNPPSLSALLSEVADIESYQAFMALVLEYLPDEYDNIKRQRGPPERISLFAMEFENQYFPLAYYLKESHEMWGDEEIGYGEVIMGMGYEGGIPIERQGLDWESIHEMSLWSPGDLLMGVVSLPGWDRGLGSVWIEAAAADNPDQVEQLKRLPEGGWEPMDLDRWLEDTDYEVVAKFFDYLTVDTGNAFLDTNQERGFADAWDPELVKDLVNDWHHAQVFIDQIRNMADWIVVPGHFRELLDFIYAKQDEMGKRPEGAPAARTLWEMYQEDFEQAEENDDDGE